MTPPLSDLLVIWADGSLRVMSAGRLYHKVAKLRLPQGCPNWADYVELTIW